jgi:hypothetical protein
MKYVHGLTGKTGTFVKEFNNPYGRAIMIRLDNGREWYAPAHEFEQIQTRFSGSALIAEYMQIKEIQSFYDSSGTDVPIWYCGYLGYRTPAFGVQNKSIKHLLSENKFNNSWDWLMPVIEKIISVEKFEDGECVKLRTFGTINDKGLFMVRFDRHQLFQSKDFLQASFEAVVDFLRNRD